MNFFIIFFPDKVVKLVGGGSVINGATPSSLLADEERPEWQYQVYSLICLNKAMIGPWQTSFRNKF